MAKILEIRVGPPRDALDRFEAAWNRLADGAKVSPVRVLTLQDLPSVVRTLSPERWKLLQNLRKNGSCSIYQLAKRLNRNYKNVHTDVTALIDAGLIEKISRTEIAVAWDAVRAELRF